MRRNFVIKSHVFKVYEQADQLRQAKSKIAALGEEIFQHLIKVFMLLHCEQPLNLVTPHHLSEIDGWLDSCKVNLKPDSRIPSYEEYFDWLYSSHITNLNHHLNLMRTNFIKNYPTLNDDKKQLIRFLIFIYLGIDITEYSVAQDQGRIVWNYNLQDTIKKSYADYIPRGVIYNLTVQSDKTIDAILLECYPDEEYNPNLGNQNRLTKDKGNSNG